MRIVFCGVGAVGSSAAVLCRTLGAEMAFVDFDRVESKNLAAQAFVKASLGKNKAEALKLQMGTFYGLRAEAFPAFSWCRSATRRRGFSSSSTLPMSRVASRDPSSTTMISILPG